MLNSFFVSDYFKTAAVDFTAKVQDFENNLPNLDLNK